MSAKFKLMVRLAAGSGLGILLAGTLLSGCKKEPPLTFREDSEIVDQEADQDDLHQASHAPRNAFSQPSNTGHTGDNFAIGIKTIIIPDDE